MSRRRHLWLVRRQRVALARLLRRCELDTSMAHTAALLTEWAL
jgi:hypothetical protein